MIVFFSVFAPSPYSFTWISTSVVAGDQLDSCSPPPSFWAFGIAFLCRLAPSPKTGTRSWGRVVGTFLLVRCHFYLASPFQIPSIVVFCLFYGASWRWSWWKKCNDYDGYLVMKVILLWSLSGDERFFLFIYFIFSCQKVNLLPLVPNCKFPTFQNLGWFPEHLHRWSQFIERKANVKCRDTKSQDVPVGSISRAKTFRTESVNWKLETF